MKKILLGPIIITFVSLLALAQADTEISPNDVEKIYFHIYKSLGAIKGYIIFYDKNNNMCATTGRFSLYKEITTYTTEKSVIHPPETVAKTERQYIDDIIFNTKDFQPMELKDRTVIYALPFSLSGDRANQGDVIVLKWYNFEMKKTIYEIY